VQDPLLLNLSALVRGSRETVGRIRAAQPRSDARIIQTADAVPAVELVDGDKRVALCSRHSPLQEARNLIDQVSIAEAAIFVAIGFGMGYHVAELARRVKATGLILVFEPDIELLRTALESVDHSEWINEGRVAFLTDPHDSGAVSRALQGNEMLVALGVKIIPHPPSAELIAPVREQFDKVLSNIIDAACLTIRTSLTMTKTTMRNLIQNSEYYLVGSSARSDW